MQTTNNQASQAQSHIKCKQNKLTHTFDRLITTYSQLFQEVPNCLAQLSTDDEWTNFEFVKTFDGFENFEDAADFINDWIKVAKHKPASV